MTTKEAARMSELTKRQIRNLVADDKIEAEKEGGAWNIDKKSLEDFLKNHKDNKKKDGDEMKEKETKEEKTVETTTTAPDPITDLLNSEISRKKTLSALRALEDLDEKREPQKMQKKKDDLDLNTIIKFDLIKSLKNPPMQTSREESKKDDMLEKLMLYQMMQQNSQKPAIASDKSSSELELLKRELLDKRENEALKQELASLRQEIKELQSQKSLSDYSSLEQKLDEKLRSFQPSSKNDWAGILTGAGSVLSSLLQALPMLRSEGISLTEIGDLVDRLTERKQQSTSADNLGSNDLMNNVVGLISSLAKQKQGQQAKQAQFAGSEEQQRVSEATTASPVDQLALALTGAVKAAESPNSVINAIHSMLPYISEQHIPIIENLMNQLNPTWTETVVEALEDELNVEFSEEETEETEVVEEASRPSRKSRRFESSTEHDLSVEK